ncbi:DUF948 domain-containing protein [Microlunatus antarcticus]|uniref:Uncharacterized protein YoxC n=1 Tax=Microlunatus antarcticus TaxID=53388 RepID=A0A7W5JVZ0_9ACTN|nr:uncharacterized protein YoxC [Microlunatus antarcticus]
MTLGQIAGLLAALACVGLVAFLAVPLLKLGRVLDELRVTVRDLGQETVPILTELQGTVRATNEELGKLSLVTADVAKVSANASLVSDNAAQLSGIVNATVARPLVKTAALGHGLRQAVRRSATDDPDGRRAGRRARRAEVKVAMAEREAELRALSGGTSAGAPATEPGPRRAAERPGRAS